MRRSPTIRALLAASALVLVASSCAGRDDDSGSKDNGSNTTAGGNGSTGSTLIDTADCPDNDTAGISGDTITLASSFPQSGLTAAFAQISKGYKAYFDKVNADGGVEVGGKKYKIKVVDKDDEYNAAKTTQNITELVGTSGDKAFAVFNVVGTANNIAIREALGEECVPDIFAATGAPTWGNPDYPWLIGSTLAPYSLEAKAYADYLVKNEPKATVAMLVQDDDYGAVYEESFKKAIEGTDIKVVKVAKYAPGAGDVTSQVTSLAATKADVFFNGATLLACPDALTKAKAAGWNPILFVSGTCISKTLMGLAGANADKAIAATNVMDPTNPAYAETAAMKEYRATLDQYGASDVDPDNGIVAYGYTQAVVLVEALKKSPELSRSALMETLHALELDQVGLLVDGATVHTDAKDPFLVENLQLVQYDAAAAHFNNLGEILDYEGKTAEFTPKDLIEN
jgi:branched-chain amino acid transport system substrate-binding protein